MSGPAGHLAYVRYRWANMTDRSLRDSPGSVGTPTKVILPVLMLAVFTTSVGFGVLLPPKLTTSATRDRRSAAAGRRHALAAGLRPRRCRAIKRLAALGGHPFDDCKEVEYANENKAQAEGAG